MRHHLHISVTFLQPTCHARLGKEDAALNEWPPSPLRLFQAMVAGAAARWAGDNSSIRGGGETGGALAAAAPVAALKWLESLCASSPPTILAPRAVTGQAVPRYVPNNSADLVAAKWARGDALATFEDRTKKVFRPTHLLGGSTVHYLWELKAGDQQREAAQHEPTIAAAARCIVALGWGIDAAVGDARVIDDAQAATLDGERWEPCPRGGDTPSLRLPVSGTLDALKSRHTAFLDRLKDGVFRPVPPLRAFSSTTYRRASDLPPRPFAAFVLRPIDKDSGYAAFPAARAVHVAAMLRHAACDASRGDLDPSGWRTNHWSLRYVAGHGPEDAPKRRSKDDDHPRFSYLPLPSIGHAHADGMIRRVLIAEPFGGDGRSARWAAQRLAGAALIDEDKREPVARLEPVALDEPAFASVFRLYSARAASEAMTIWTSITPVILPGYDDNKPAKREKLLLDCLHHAGIDLAAVDSIESRPSAWQPSGGGALTAPIRGYKRPNYLQHLPAVHVRLTLTQRISGPLSLGAGRHCGLGVFALVREA